jgi:hypothetical protein
MAYEESVRSITLDADSSIGIYTGVPGMPGSTDPNYGKQFCFLKVTGAHQVGLATAAANELLAGVLQNKPQRVGEAATVGQRGVSLVMAGAAVSAGAGVKCDATSRAVTATPGTDVAVGIAIGSASGAGEVFPVLLRLSL